MEKKMETTIMGYIGYNIGVIMRLYGDNGKENGNHYSITPISPTSLGLGIRD